MYFTFEITPFQYAFCEGCLYSFLARECASMRVSSGNIRHRLMGAVSQRRCWEMGWEEGRRAVGIDTTCHSLSDLPAVTVSARGVLVR